MPKAKPTPAKPAIRYAVVDAQGEIVSYISSDKLYPKQLVDNHGDGTYRVAKFRLTEEPPTNKTQLKKS